MTAVIERRVDVVSEDLPTIDYDQLEAGVGEDKELLRELVPLFLDDSESCLNRLSDAIRIGDAEGVRVAAHTLAGTASAFAAIEVTALARRIERTGATGKLAGVGEAFVDLESAFARLRPLLEECAADDRP